MKRVLALFSLFFITNVAFAEYCQPPADPYKFSAATWFNAGGNVGPIRCSYYYYSKDGAYHDYATFTSQTYTEESIKSRREWYKSSNDNYPMYTCVSPTGYVNTCPFG